MPVDMHSETAVVERELSPFELDLASAIDYALAAEDSWQLAISEELEVVMAAEGLQPEILPVVVRDSDGVQSATLEDNRRVRKTIAVAVEKSSRWLQFASASSREAASNSLTIGGALARVTDIDPLSIMPAPPKDIENSLEEKRLIVLEGTYALTFDHWEGFYEGRRMSLGAIYNHLQNDPTDIDVLTKWIEDQPRPRPVDTQALLTHLANDINDPNGDGMFTFFWERISSAKIRLDLQEEFFRTKLESSEAGPVDPNTQWLEFIGRLMQIEPNDTIAKLLENQDDWPDSLKSDYQQFWLKRVATTKERLTKALEPDVRRARFEPQLDTQSKPNDHPSDKSRQKRRSGRTTPKVQIRDVTNQQEESPSQEDNRPFKGFGRFVRTDSGYIFQEISPEDADDMLADYAKKRSEPKLIPDLQAMLQSIQEKPYGDGAAVYRDIMINVNGKATKLWHLSPNKRHGLDLGTRTARRTRILYGIVSDPDGYTIAIHGVRHHDDIGDGYNSIRYGKDL
jgi:hypothetical protein